MHPAIPHLIELQRVDHQIAVMLAELDGFPKRMREAETKLGSARAEVASAKEAFSTGSWRAARHQEFVEAVEDVPVEPTAGLAIGIGSRV